MKSESVVTTKQHSVSARPGLLPNWLGWTICILAALFYAYEYYLRISVSVISDQLMLDYHINATRIGSLYAIYYFIYAPMQLPAGVLVDKFGPRRLLTIACMICALGAFLFTATPYFAVVMVGRALIGFGSAFAFIGVLKLATIWLPAERFAFVASCNSALGTIGAMVGDISLTYLVQRMGYRPTLAVAAGVGFLLSLLIYFVVRDVSYQHDDFDPDNNIEFRQVITGLFQILRSRSIWLTGLVGMFIYLPTTAFAEAWGIGYLQYAQHLSREEAAFGVSMLFLGFTMATPLSGVISDLIKRRTLPMLIGGLLGALFMTIILYGGETLVPTKITLYTLLFLVGVSYSVQPLVFAIGKEISPLYASGTAVAVINAFVMLGGFIMPQVIGLLLDLSWDFQDTADGVRIYSPIAYQHAMTVVPIGMVLGSLCAWFICENRLAEKREQHQA